MNDISVKIVEFGKEQAGIEIVAAADPVANNEVDPLAIEEAKVKEVPETDERIVAPEIKPEPVEKADSCDQNAKDENISLNQDIANDDLKLDTEQVKDELHIEDTISIGSTIEDPSEIIEAVEDPNEITETVENGTESDPTTQPDPEPIPDPGPAEIKPPPVVEAIEVPQVADSKEVTEVTAVPEVREPSPVKEVCVVPEVPLVPKVPVVRLVPVVPLVPLVPVVPIVPEKEVKEVKVVEKVAEPDVEIDEVPVKVKIEDKFAQKPLVQAVNGDVIKEEQATKRRSSEEIETESPLKRLCQEVEKTYPHHDTMINDYIQSATKNNVDELQRHTEQLLSEIQTLRELAQKKEHEWNNILHLKKVKEEILLRLLRRKQVLSFEKAADINGAERTDPFDYLNQAKNYAIDKSDEISGLSLSLKPPVSPMNPMMQAPVMPVTSHFNPMVGLPPPYDKAAHMQGMPKPIFPQPLMLPGPTMPCFPRDMNGQIPTSYGMPMGRQGPTKDVKSIIADYRQRNPDITPRRGRRMKSILNQNMMNNPRAIAPKIMDGMNSYNNLNNLNMLFNNLDMNQKAMLDRLQQIQAGSLPNGLSFKDVLVQFANMQQGPGMMPTRPPETVTHRPPEHHIRPESRRRPERNHEEIQKQAERMASPGPRLPPPPPYPEISLLPVTTSQETPTTQQNSLLHGILTKQAPPAQSYSPTLAKLLTSPERKQCAPNLPAFGQAKNCGEITITPVQPTPTPPDAPAEREKAEEVVQLDSSPSPGSSGSAAASPAGSGSGRLVIDEAADDAPSCQGCRRRAAQFVCAGCANQWYCSRDCQVAAWDDHSEMCSG